MSHQTNFKAVMQNLLPDDGEHYPHLLEQRFPHILQRMIACWDKPEMADYLDSLLAPPQAGAKGFPLEAIAEIAMIKAAHHARFRGEHPAASPQIDQAPLPDQPSPATSTDEEHEAAMVFDRIHRW